jgi:periplasmic divalent cation tolerance protein
MVRVLIIFIIQTSSYLVAEATAKIKEIHPYDVPEVIATDVTGGSDAYIQWVVGETIKKRNKSDKE